MNSTPELSVVVVFHNMRREARRTLYSLSSKYQKNISSADYEVIAVDSNSTEPIDERALRSFGPQYHCLGVNWEHPSPCHAMNCGIERAKGDIIICNIDGARILSPGILSGVSEVFRKVKNPFVYTLGMHLGPRVQNESMLDGYNQLIEDELLEKTNWKQNGYKLFAVSSVALSSKKGFYSRLTESNCFALRKETLGAIGGFDERFVSPGGGLVNLDIFRQVMEQDDITPVMLLGEATFHQYHGGVATNVPLAEHPRKQFAEEYQNIRGKKYVAQWRKPLYFGHTEPEAMPFANGCYTNPS